jgi:hypothetical protein
MGHTIYPVSKQSLCNYYPRLMSRSLQLMTLPESSPGLWGLGMVVKKLRHFRTYPENILGTKLQKGK